MADLSKVKVGTLTYNIKDAEGRNIAATLSYNLEKEVKRAEDVEATITANLTSEVTRATGVEAGLQTRIENLEARGRFLSNWNAVTGLPADYPAIPSTATTTYTYGYRVGDYYIVGTVDAASQYAEYSSANNYVAGDKCKVTNGETVTYYICKEATTGTFDPAKWDAHTISNYQPTGATITATKNGDTWEWSIGKAADTREIGVGDYYICSTISGTPAVATWVLVSNSQKTVFFSNIAGKAKDNLDLKGELESLLSKDATVAGVAFTGDTPNVDKASLQTALELAALAYKSSASGTVEGQTISGVKATGSLSADITGDLGTTITAATLTKAAYTPAGKVKVANVEDGQVAVDGSITVTVKDASAKSEASLTTATYTPTGNVTAKAEGGAFEALTGATFQKNADGIQIEGTISKPAVTVDDTAKDTFIKTIVAGDVAAATFTQGTKASLTDQTTAKFVKKAHSFTVGTGADAETLIIGDVETTDTTYYNDAVTNRGTFTPNGDDTFNAEKLPVAGTTATAVTGVTAELAATPTFTGEKYNINASKDTALKEVVFTATNSTNVVNKVEYFKQEIDTATFTPTMADVTFVGTQVADFQVTGVTYDKATKGTLGAEASLPEGGLTVGDIAVQAKSVTVE